MVEKITSFLPVSSVTDGDLEALVEADLLWLEPPAHTQMDRTARRVGVKFTHGLHCQFHLVP
jgi:hypothetical protein